MDHVFMSGFFRGGEAAESLSRCRCLHYRGRGHHSDCIGGLSGVGVAELVRSAWSLCCCSLDFPSPSILAWAFDVTPEGVRVTAPSPSLPAHRRGRRKLIFILLTIGVVVSAVTGFFLLPRASARKLDKSIAVLPFENLSDDKENAFFADGMQDDILTNLSKIGELKVISRTSVMGYRGKTANVREIGKQLGVSNILEGSVRRSGNKVRGKRAVDRRQ